MVPFGLGRNVQPAILIKPQMIDDDEYFMQEMYSIFLQQHELILISSDVTAHARAFCGTRAHILPSFFGKVVRAAISELWQLITRKRKRIFKN